MISKDNPWRVGIRYEVALETLDAITAHYAGVKGLEREKPNPDEAVIEDARRIQDEMFTLRHSLKHDDEEAIEALIKKYAPIARELWDSWEQKGDQL
jgi:hypothetical protein